MSTSTVIAVLQLSISFLRVELVPLKESSPHFSVSCCLSMTIQFQNFQTIVCLKLVRKKQKTKQNNNLFCKNWGGRECLETIFDV